ncbi:VanW family protein [Clostridium sp.]|uniref:VanW family protein n=1 Tax=Clostridium sp. TaxID=1506 RepID=UPI002634FB0B|nr:VanW family protein [Clostridium sp.]
MSNNNEINTTNETEVLSTKENGIITFLKTYKFLIIIFLFLISILSYFIIKNVNLVNNYSNRVYPGAYILNKDLSGLTQEELNKELTSFVSNLNTSSINVTSENLNFNLSYTDLGINIDYDTLEKDIINFGKDLSFFKKLNLIKKPKNREYTFDVLSNEEVIDNFISTIAEAINISPVNASISIAGGINIYPDKTGISLNEEELKSEIQNKINNINPPNIIEVTGNTTVTEASIKATDLNNVDSKISNFTTKYLQGPSGTNLQLAAINIDDTIVMPGETFSTEKAIGPTTLATGFVSANTYVGGEVIPGIGGGVCQVASTLYNTMLRSGIIPIERLNHMMKVSYVPIGLDATLADNLIDLRFTNEFDYPIVINSYTSGNYLTIEFWSKEGVNEGIRYEPVSVPLNDLSADTYLYGYDSNGNIVINEYLSRSTYAPFPTN